MTRWRRPWTLPGSIQSKTGVSVARAALPTPSLRAGMSRVTADQARRIATAARGFAGTLPRGPVTRAHLRRLVERIQVLQLDSVSVAVRAHYAPVFQQAGPLRPGGARWGGVESQCPGSPSAGGVLGARSRADVRRGLAAAPLADAEYIHGRWGTEIVKNNPRLADEIVAAVAELGPSTAGQIDLSAEPRGRRAGR